MTTQTEAEALAAEIKRLADSLTTQACHHAWADIKCARTALHAASDRLAALAASAQASVPTGFVSTVAVEKLLCEKLGRQWSPAGMSIDSLINELAAEEREPLTLSEFREWFARRLKACGAAGVTDQTALAEDVVRWTEAKHGITPKEST